MDIWLRSNRRFFALALLAPALVAALLAAGFAWAVASGVVWAVVVLGILLGGAVVILVALVWVARQPRLACDGRRLCIYVRFTGPVCVPLEYVEGFLLGTAPSHLPGATFKQAETSTVVIKIADRATQWAHVDVDSALGGWCNHYVRLHGIWCEPLSVDLVNRLNERLGAAHAALRAATPAAESVR